eukprot:GILI01015564.1.p1 GENE.GILI01015564.1~~GILI01015564.1.p1  ORF type:complete len:273 (+),score=71.31 GILI01015564.1:46-819(+)
MKSAKAPLPFPGYSWKWIPVIFILWLVIEVTIVMSVFYSLKGEQSQRLRWPTDLETAKMVGEILSGYVETNYYSLMFALASTFLFLQTWCIPGTVFMNLLAGALFGIWAAFPLCLFLNTLGAFCSFSLSRFFGRELIFKYFPQKIVDIKALVEEHRHDLLYYMTFLRLLPASPNWFMNLSFPHIGIPLKLFVPSIAIGLTPWNYFTCRAGLLLSQLKSRSDIVNTSTYLQLALLACVFLIPPLAKKFMNRKTHNKAR